MAVEVVAAFVANASTTNDKAADLFGSALHHRR
jgi:hypothetical protein